ncbi:MAG: hypothetical protein ACXQS4_04015, partial [Methermicoccaceae archaeon]
ENTIEEFKEKGAIERTINTTPYLFLNEGVDEESGETVYRVLNTQNGFIYITTITSCSCPDHTYRHTTCKHMQVVRELEGEGQSEPPSKAHMDENMGIVVDEQEDIEVIDMNEEEEKETAAEEVKQKINQQAVVVSKPPTPQTIDSLDEQLIIEEEVLGAEPLVYRIPTKQGHKHILSMRGWVQAMLLQKNIVVEDIDFRTTVEGKDIAVARVKDLARNVSVMGVAERVGASSEFKWTVLASKATRNALKKLISPKYEHEVIAAALKQEHELVLDLRGGM